MENWWHKPYRDMERKPMSLRKKEQLKVDIMGLKYLHAVCGVTSVERVRNEEVRRSVDVRENISDRVDQKVLNGLDRLSV